MREANITHTHIHAKERRGEDNKDKLAIEAIFSILLYACGV